MKGALERMLKRQLSMAWEKWQYEAAQMKHEKFIMGGALNRFRNRLLSMAWEKWQFTAADKALRRFLHAKMFAAWNMWRSWAEEMRRQAYVLKGALERMLHRLLS